MILKISLIAAISENNVIGKDGSIPWYLPDDLKRFKALTSGYPIVMGRKTFESIGGALPNRINYVLTSSILNLPNVFACKNIEEVLRNIENKTPNLDNIDYSKLWVIGGSKVYESFLPMANSLELTKLKGDYAGDTFFPKIDLNEWKQISYEQKEGYSFVSYQKVIR